MTDGPDDDNLARDTDRCSREGGQPPWRGRMPAPWRSPVKPRPTERGFPEQRPCDLGKPVGFTIAAAQQEHQSVVGQILDRMLLCPAGDPIRLARVANDPRICHSKRS
jgi:hypothetical protein